VDNLAPVDDVPQSVETQPSPTDTDLFCPHCGYNVRALPEDRCPECGEPFDRMALLRWTVARDLPLGLNWLGRERTLRQIWTTCLMQPQSIGRELPPHPNRENAILYGIATRCASALMVAVMAVLTTRDAEAVMLLAVWTGPILATIFCEAILASLLARFVEPVAVPPGHRYRFWRTLCTCFSAHFPVSCAVMPLLSWGVQQLTRNEFLSSANRSTFVMLYRFLPFLGVVTLMVWWWWGLSRAIAARSNPSLGRSVITMLIPVIGGVAIVLGMLMFALLSAACFPLMR
jgi:hypothetical protein